MKTKHAAIILVLLLAFTVMACNKDKSGSTSNKASPLVCLGDSLTAGHGADIPGVDNMEKSYPAFLRNRINIPVINAGVSGDITAQGLYRVKDDVLSENPGVIIIELGANDLLQGIPLSVTHRNLQSIISMMNNGSRKIYLAKFYTETIARAMLSLLQITDHDEQTAAINRYDAMFDELSRSNNVTLIDDIWAGVWGIHMSDRIHPNEEGYRIMANNYFDILKPYFDANGLLN